MDTMIAKRLRSGNKKPVPKYIGYTLEQAFWCDSR